MRTITIIALLFFLVACSSSTPKSATIEKAVAETLAAQPPALTRIPCPACNLPDTPTPYPMFTQYPTLAPYPTHTPLSPLPTYTLPPTYTPQPTLEPVVIFVTATAPPDFTKLYEFTGKGKSTTDLFSLQPGLIRIKWEYTGTSNFAFYLKELDTGYEELLENTIGSTSGQSILKIENTSDQYLFDVKYAQGNWTIVVEYKP